MQNIKKLVLLSGFTAAIVLGCCKSTKSAGDINTTMVNDVVSLMEKHHYKPIAINDSFSLRVHTLFLEQLDDRGLFFTRKDLELFDNFKYKLDDEIKSKKYDFWLTVSNLHSKRVAESESYANKALTNEINFEIKDEIEIPHDNKIPAATPKEMSTYWKQYVKFLVLDNYVRKTMAQEDAISKADTSYKIVVNDTLIERAKTEVAKNQALWFKRLKRITTKEIFDIYLNAITGAFDPHSNFYPPREKEDFDIRLSGQFEGIGATLSERDGYIKVENIVPGSASYRQGDLKAGDLIIAVAQGKENAVNTVNMSVGDIVQLIRGKKGTTVVLTVKRGNGSTQIIPIVRDVVIIEEGYAKSAIINDNLNRIGYINLPSFYADFNRTGGRSCAEDVAIEVMNLKQESINGLIVDLRYNGGGSLGDVVEMVGIFTGKGPSVQVKSKNQDPVAYNSRNPNALYTGPLVVLVNYYSASASEILAAALQDYGRAIIIGSNHTFGKGTVQKFEDLGNLFNAAGAGAIKVTSQKFYRINGGTTQFIGVIPDIIMPDRLDNTPIGEKELKYPLINDLVTPAIPKMIMDTKMINAIKNSQRRVNDYPYFQNQKLIADYYKRQNDNYTYSLLLKDYKAELVRLKIEQGNFDKLVIKDSIELSLPKIDQKTLEADALKLKIRQDWVKSFVKDPYLIESVKVIADLR